MKAGEGTDPLDPALLSSLRGRETRDRMGLFLAEGVRFLLGALETHTPLAGVAASHTLLRNDFARGTLKRLRKSGTPVLELPAEAFRTFSRAEEPSGILVVARQRREPLAGTPPGRRSTWLALEQVRSAGNLGTILRTCEATGVSGVILLGQAIDPYDPLCVRASMGSVFAMRLFRSTHAELRGWARGAGCAIVGTSAHALLDYRRLEYRGPVVLMMGCERRGLTREQEDLCDHLVRIPMVGRVDSLNVAVATGVLLYEVFGQRHRDFAVR